MISWDFICVGWVMILSIAQLLIPQNFAGGTKTHMYTTGSHLSLGLLFYDIAKTYLLFEIDLKVLTCSMTRCFRFRCDFVAFRFINCTFIETAEFRRWHKDPHVHPHVHNRISSQFRQREATKSINLSYPYSLLSTNTFASLLVLCFFNRDLRPSVKPCNKELKQPQLTQR